VRYLNRSKIGCFSSVPRPACTAGSEAFGQELVETGCLLPQSRAVALDGSKAETQPTAGQEEGLQGCQVSQLKITVLPIGI